MTARFPTGRLSVSSTSTPNTSCHMQAQYLFLLPLLTHPFWTPLKGTKKPTTHWYLSQHLGVTEGFSKPFTPKLCPKKVTSNQSSSQAFPHPAPAKWLCSGFLHLPPVWAPASYPAPLYPLLHSSRTGARAGLCSQTDLFLSSCVIFIGV